MRIIHTIAGTRLDHGGTSRSVPAICDALVEIGLDLHFLTARPHDTSILSNYPKAIDRVHLALEGKRLRQWGVGRQFSEHLGRLTHGQKEVIVHDHAVWLASNHAVAQFCKHNNITRIVSPRGMLGEWAMGNGKWKKRIAWNLYQRNDLKSAQAFHATSEQEAKEVRALGFKQPIAVIPNGVDIPTDIPQRVKRPHFQVLFLSRVHPKKGLVNLLQAWKDASLPHHWRLVIAGPDEKGHRNEIESLVASLELSDRVTFTGPLDDSAKWRAYSESNLFILPSFNENFGIVIAEAMAAGLPVITTTGTPWSVLKEQSMGWWVEPNAESLVLALRAAASLSESALSEMGKRASHHVAETYSWTKAAQMMAQFYSSVLHGSERYRSP